MSAFSVVPFQNAFAIYSKRPREETLIPITLLHANGKEILVSFVEENLFSSMKVYSKSDESVESYFLEDHLGMCFHFLDLSPRSPMVMEALRTLKDSTSQQDTEITRLRNLNATELKGKENAKERKANCSKIHTFEQEIFSKNSQRRELLDSDEILQICEDADIDRLCGDFAILMSTHGVVPGINCEFDISKRSLFLHVTDETFTAMKLGHSVATDLAPSEGSIPVVLLFLYDGIADREVCVRYVPHLALPAPFRSACQEDVDRKKFFNLRYCSADVEDKDYDFKGYTPPVDFLDEPDDAFGKQFNMFQALVEEAPSAFPDSPFYLCGVYYLESSC